MKWWLVISLIVMPQLCDAQSAIDTIPFPTYLDQSLKLRIEDQPLPCDSIDTLDRTIYYWFYDSKRWFAKVYVYYDKQFQTLAFKYLAHMAVGQDGRWLAIVLGNRYNYKKDGKLESVVRYEEGIRSGPAFFYDRYGTLRQTGEHLRDVKSGLWKYYKKDGSLQHEVDYGIPPAGIFKLKESTNTPRHGNPGFD